MNITKTRLRNPKKKKKDFLNDSLIYTLKGICDLI